MLIPATQILRGFDLATHFTQSLVHFVVRELQLQQVRATPPYFTPTCNTIERGKYRVSELGFELERSAQKNTTIMAAPENKNVRDLNGKWTIVRHALSSHCFHYTDS